MNAELIPVVVSSFICLALITFRCGYRLLNRCQWHTSCFRTWHRDDTTMAVSLVVLGARAGCIGVAVEPPLYTLPSDRDQVLSGKLVIPARLFYALFLWCMKFCLLDFYSRLSNGLPSFRRGASILRICLIITYIAIIFPTVLECRPMSLYWNGSPEGDRCRLARANYITMGTLDLATDIALIIFPIPIVWKAGMQRSKQLRLAVLFSVGLLVIVITSIRLPLTLRGSVSQKIRSLWADIEIASACLVANASFYYTLFKEQRGGHPALSGDGLRRNTQPQPPRAPHMQQWQIARQPSCAVHVDDDDDDDEAGAREAKPSRVDVEVGGSEGCSETFEEWEARGIGVLHLEMAGGGAVIKGL